MIEKLAVGFEKCLSCGFPQAVSKPHVHSDSGGKACSAKDGDSRSDSSELSAHGGSVNSSGSQERLREVEHALNTENRVDSSVMDSHPSSRNEGAIPSPLVSRPMSVFEIKALVHNEPHIATLADDIHQLVRARGSVKLDELARALKQPRGDVERLCDILEQQGVLSLDYNLFSTASVSLR